MPQPGDDILLSASLIGTYGKYPTTHSCDVEVRDSDGIVVLTKTAMANIVGAVYSYKWETSEALPEGPYHVIYYAVLDGEDAPEIGEVIYIEKVGIEPDDLQPVLDAIAAHDTDIKALIGSSVHGNLMELLEQMWYVTFCHVEKAFQYDSQGRTEVVIARYSDTNVFTSPKAMFRHTFSYNADNGVEVWNIERLSP